MQVKPPALPIGILVQYDPQFDKNSDQKGK